MKRIDKEIIELNNLETFVKIKSNSLGIGKLQLAFVSFDKKTNKIKNSIDIYMETADALLLSNDILSGKIAILADTERKKAKASGSKYPSACYVSTFGGINEEVAKNRGMRNDGMAVSRHFDISPGAKLPFILTAYQGPGKSDDKGLIAAAGKPEIIIRVGISADDLKKAALMIQTHINAFLTAQYISGDFDSTYTPQGS